MNKEKIDNSIDNLFAEKLFENDYSNQQISRFEGEIALERPVVFQNEEFLDKCLAAIKFVFLFIPGTMAINMVGSFAYLLILYGEAIPSFFPELSGFALVGTFLTMLGIGKLKDLSYLKVPGAVLASSILFSILHAIFEISIGHELFGYFFFSSFPIVAFVGYFVKKMLDKDR